MSTETETDTITLDVEYIASSTTRRRLSVATILLTWVLIAWITVYGSPTNSLHESALGWAFMTNVAVLFAYAFGTILTKYITK